MEACAVLHGKRNRFHSLIAWKGTSQDMVREVVSPKKDSRIVVVIHHVPRFAACVVSELPEKWNSLEALTRVTTMTFETGDVHYVVDDADEGVYEDWTRSRPWSGQTVFTLKKGPGEEVPEEQTSPGEELPNEQQSFEATPYVESQKAGEAVSAEATDPKAQATGRCVAVPSSLEPEGTESYFIGDPAPASKESVCSMCESKPAMIDVESHHWRHSKVIVARAARCVMRSRDTTHSVRMSRQRVVRQCGNCKKPSQDSEKKGLGKVVLRRPPRSFALAMGLEQP